MEVLDRAAALRRLGGNEKLFKEALQSFQRRGPGELESLARALQSGDAPLLEKRALALQEAAAQVGASGMEHVLSCIAEAAQAGDLSEVATLLAKLEMEFDWLCLILNTQACSGNL